MAKFRSWLGIAAIVAALAALAPAVPASAHVQAITINPTGTVPWPEGGNATVSGTFTCTAGESAVLQVFIAQIVHGQVISSPIFFVPPPPGFTLCTGSAQPWTASVAGFVGFKPGHANVIVTLQTFGIDGFDTRTDSRTVKLGPS